MSNKSHQTAHDKHFKAFICANGENILVTDLKNLFGGLSMNKTCLLLPVLFFGTAIFAQFKDVTDDFTSFFNERFVGQISQGSLT